MAVTEKEPTPVFVDPSGRRRRALIITLAVVAALAVGYLMLLLMSVFRSLAVAVKAAVMNLLSIGAAYGIMALAAGGGWFGGLVGIEEATPVPAWLPMTMFAVLFGLSMDYEVFLLSRVREEYVRTRDNRRAVADGLAATARVITSAALIMISVFRAFVPNPDPTVKMLGLGLAVRHFEDFPAEYPPGTKRAPTNVAGDVLIEFRPDGSTVREWGVLDGVRLSPHPLAPVEVRSPGPVGVDVRRAGQECRAGDVVLAHYLLVHGVASHIGPDIRYMCFFRIHHRDHKANGDACMTDAWRDWEGLREVVGSA